MRVWVVTALVGLAAVGSYGSSGLLDVLGLEPDEMIEISGINIPSVDKTGEDDAPPCGVSPSKTVADATAECADQAMTGGGRGKGKRKGGRRRRSDEIAIQKCVFEKLSLVDKDGTPIQAEIGKLIDTYTGNSEGKQVMKRMSEKCMATIGSAPAKNKAGVLMTCVKKSMADTCKMIDLKKESPSLALMVAQKSAEKCMESIELPPEFIWSRVRCTAEALKKFADTRLAALAPVRSRRSPQRDKGSKKEIGSKESGDNEDREERRKKLKARRLAGKKKDMEMAKERLEKVVGPLDKALEAAGEALQETQRCTYAAVGILDADNNVDSKKMKMMMSELTGTPKVKATLMAAAEVCFTKGAAFAAFMECLNSELTVTCPAALSADRRQKKAGRRAERNGRRQTAQAGKPPKVGKPKMPAALRQKS